MTTITAEHYAALRKACCLALRRCPNCARDLQPIAQIEDVWGCKPCRETWHIETK